jgi:hypothetical protein
MTIPQRDAYAIRIDADEGRGVIEVSLRELRQLFNSFDPSPFPHKDLDDDAEEFIVSWAREFHRRTPLRLVVHLQEPVDSAAAKLVEHDVQRFFAYRTELTRCEFRQLMKRGRISLLIGLAFLSTCLTVVKLMGGFGDAPLIWLMRESIMIVGWVAMWRPLEIFLYDWWPLASLLHVYRRLGAMPVELRAAASTASD